VYRSCGGAQRIYGASGSAHIAAALVHELLQSSSSRAWQNRAQFLAVAFADDVPDLVDRPPVIYEAFGRWERVMLVRGRQSPAGRCGPDRAGRQRCLIRARSLSCALAADVDEAGVLAVVATAERGQAARVALRPPDQKRTEGKVSA
jgi:hypothetical protein